MDENVKYGIFGYSDGGASPNPGPCGSGVHICHYHYPTEGEKPTSFGRFIVTDEGYFTQKELDAIKPAKRPKLVVVDRYVDIVRSLGDGTNNIGEMVAMDEFLAHAINHIQASAGKDCVKVHGISDSKLVIYGINEYLPGWLQRNWITTSGKPVANREIWESIKANLDTVTSLTQFSCSWTLGHNDEFGNTRADILASIAVNYSQGNQLTRVEKVYDKPKDFFNCDLSFHPFFCLQRVYFNSASYENKPGIYYQTSGGDDKFVTGKRTGDAVYSVIKLNNPDELADGLIEAAARDDRVNTVLYFRYDRANELTVRQMFTDHGAYCFNPDKRNFNLNFADKRPVVFEVKPGELPLRSIDTLQYIEEMLDSYHFHVTEGAEFQIPGTKFEMFDITDFFYDSKMKGKGAAEIEVHELKKEFGVGATGTAIKLPVTIFGTSTEVKFNLLFGLDLPARNSMRKLEALHPMVQLIAWQAGDSSIRFAVVIRTDEAIGIWSNYHANLLLI